MRSELITTDEELQLFSDTSNKSFMKYAQYKNPDAISVCCYGIQELRKYIENINMNHIISSANLKSNHYLESNNELMTEGLLGFIHVSDVKREIPVYVTKNMKQGTMMFYYAN